MSKRYGRQQKRRHRRRIAELEALLTISRKSHDFTESSRLACIAQHNVLVENLKRAFGKHSTLLPPRRLDGFCPRGDVLRIRPDRGRAFTASPIPTYATYSVANLHAVTIDVEVKREDFGDLHCFAKIEDREECLKWHYFISGRMWQQSFRDLIVDEVTSQLRHELTAAFERKQD